MFLFCTENDTVHFQVQTMMEEDAICIVAVQWCQDKGRNSDRREKT